MDGELVHELRAIVRDEDGHIHRGIGAWQILARYSYLNLNDDVIKGGQLASYTVGANWFLNSSITFQANYVFAHRNTAAPAISGEGNAFGLSFRYIW